MLKSMGDSVRRPKSISDLHGVELDYWFALAAGHKRGHFYRHRTGDSAWVSAGRNGNKKIRLAGQSALIDAGLRRFVGDRFGNRLEGAPPKAWNAYDRT